MSRSYLLLVVSALAVAAPVAALAESECTADCGCFCDPSWHAGCTIFCAPGWNAACYDGFCEGAASKCCCWVYVLGRPSGLAKVCDTADCGIAPPITCANLRQTASGKAAAGVVRAAGPAPSPDHPCKTLLGADQEERWYLMEYRVDAAGQTSDLKVSFASDPGFAAGIQDCAAQGHLDLHPQDVGPHPVFETNFKFMPAADWGWVREKRRIHLTFPDLGQLSGTLAVRVEMTKEVEILDKKLLFSSNPELGKRVLEQLDDSLEVVSGGDSAGPFLDVFFLTFQSGEMVVFSQSHYAVKAGETA
jgi:hypothetical protein